MATHSTRTTRAIVATVVTLATTLLLNGCILGDPDTGMKLTVTNHTTWKLGIRIRTTPDGYVESGQTTVVSLSFSKSGCYQVEAVTRFETRVATYPGRACDGDTWVIEPSDLVEVPEPPSPTPLASAAPGS
jgi:hypothetical protein